MLATHKEKSLVLNDAEMAIVAEVKDLVVIVDSRLNFDTHIHQAVARAFVRSNLIQNALYLVTFLLFRILLKYKFCLL